MGKNLLLLSIINHGYLKIYFLNLRSKLYSNKI